MVISEVQTLSTGLVKDTSPLTQKEGTYTYALNAILESDTGDYPFITNEVGTTLSYTHPAGTIILGSVLTDTNTFIQCLVTPSTSIIGEYIPQTNSFVSIINDPSLNFDSRYPIKMLFRIRKGCERTIYFTDNLNPYRIMDVDNIAQYGSPFEATRLNLFRTLTLPEFSIVGVQDYGGNTPLGNYQFAIQYLDADLNETPWLDFTPFVPIVDEPLSSAYWEVDGGINQISGETSVGAVLSSTKSIELQVSNLDSDFSFFRVAVIMATAGVGEVSEVYLLTPQPITSSTYNWIFRGVSPSNAEPTTLAEIQAGILKIEKVGSHTQIDNRLILGNLSNESYDWAAVQQAANGISIDWLGKLVAKEDMENTGSSKSPNYYLHNKSFLRDEVYALGIYGIMNDGTTTPVFHIPGRVSNAADVVLLIVGTDIPLEDVKHLGFDSITTDIGYGSGLVPTWLVHNTALTDGTMAYWESDIDYPTDIDCTGARIYPTGPIRHHKFPDTRISPFETLILILSTPAYIIPIGIIPDLTTFLAAIPSELAVKVLDWRIVTSKRTDNDRTILDKGYTSVSRINPADFINGGVTLIYENDRYPTLVRNPVDTPDLFTHYLISPKQLIERPLYNGEYLSVEAQLSFDPQIILTAGNPVQFNKIDWDADVNNTTLYNRVINTYRHVDRYKELDGVEFLSTTPTVPLYPFVRQIMGAIYVDNASWTLPISVFGLEDAYNWAESTTGPDDVKWSYAAVKKTNRSIYSNLHNIEYLALTKETVPYDHYFGGDIFITKLEFKFGENNNFTMNHMFCESEVNMELRHEGLIEPIVQSYFKNEITNTSAIELYARGYDASTDKYYGSPDFLAYNPDFTKQPDTRPILPLPFNYNWCSDCGDQYPYRVVASEKSFQTEISDRYRIFKANNFTDLNGDCGGIEDLRVDNDNLYAFTYNYPVFIPTKPQTLQTNETLTYVGTGEIFSIPPRKMASTSYPYGGCRDWMGIITTEFGTFYPDSEQGKIYQLGNPPSLMTQGITNWLEENLPFKIDEQFYELLGYKYPWRYPTNGIGISSTYDPRHKRYILTKNDYTIADEGTFGGELSLSDVSSVAGLLYFDPDLGVFFVKNDGVTNTVIPFDNILYFVNHSWTLSYSPQHKAWASYHSYLPYLYFNDGNTYYSPKAYLTGTGVYKHNIGNFQTYYTDSKKDHVIEFIANKDPQLVKTFGSMELICNSTLDGVDSDTIFDKGWFYNSYQSTGNKTLVPKTSTFQTDYSTSTIQIDKVQRNWKLNNLRDHATAALPLSTSEWNFIRSSYFTDKVPVNLIASPSLFQYPRLRDRWLACRLTFKPTANNKLTTNIVNTQQNISYR